MSRFDLSSLYEGAGLSRYVRGSRPGAACRFPAYGLKDGFIVSIWNEPRSRSPSTLTVEIRFRPSASDSVVRVAVGPISRGFDSRHLTFDTDRFAWKSISRDIEDEPGGAGKSDGIVVGAGQGGEAAPNLVSWEWEYRIFPPDSGAFAELLRATIDELKRIARPLPETCEICGTGPVTDLTLCDGTLGRFCSACQDRIVARSKQRRKEWANAPLHLARGWAVGAASALALGTLGGCLAAYSMPNILPAGDRLLFAAVGFVLALGEGLLLAPVYAATTRALGRADDRGASVLAWIGGCAVVQANISFYLFRAHLVTRLPLGGALARAALDLFAQRPISGVVVLVYCLVLGFFAVAGGIRKERPEPGPRFETLQHI